MKYLQQRMRQSYHTLLKLSATPAAPWALTGVSATESIFFPMPPDLLLAPMVMAKPRRWVFLAALCTVASVIGGCIAWLLGYFSYELIEPWLNSLLPDWENNFARVQQWFVRWGPWVIVLTGFTPMPYKVFTFSAGVLALPLPAFILASLLGRGARFFLVAAVVRYAGARALATLNSKVAIAGWALLLLLAGGLYLVLR